MAMMTSKLALRAASRIHSYLRCPAPRNLQIGLADTMWAICESKVRRIEKAEQRRWFAASRRLKGSLRTDLEILGEHVSDIRSGIPAESRRMVSTPLQIYRDLMALDAEFEEVAIDMRRQTVQARTDSIVLESVYLGPFDIVLRWDDVLDGGKYEVEAVDPHPAARSDDTVHPHVQGTDLCVGDAQLPIRRALEQGRLYDFFLIVRQTLETYNAASAYAYLDEWSGRHCADCDVFMPEDNSYCCEQCSTVVCDQCETSCTGCSCSLCSECRTNCEKCNQDFCSPCLEPCSDCGADCCKDCRNDGTQCKQCRQEAEDQRILEEAADDSDSEAPLHADRVGEAGVPA